MAVNFFETEPTRKSVLSVIGVPRAVSTTPGHVRSAHRYLEIERPAAPSGDLGVMCRHHEGAARGRYVEHPGEHDSAGRGVKFCGGFVGDEQPGLQGQGAGNGHALLLAAGQFLHDLPGVIEKA